MNKFEQMVASSAGNIKKQRAAALSNQAKRSQQNLMNALLNKKEDILAEIESLTDLAPKQLTSLTPGIDNGFSTDNWVKELHTKNVALWQVELEIKIAEKNSKEWFGDVNGNDAETATDGVEEAIEKLSNL